MSRTYALLFSSWLGMGALAYVGAPVENRSVAGGPNQNAVAAGQAAWRLATAPAAVVRKIRRNRIEARLGTQESFPKLKERAHWNAVLEVDQGNGKSELRKSESLNPDYLFSFENSKEEFEDVRPKTVGYCWGFSSLLKRFKYLAKFRPEQARLPVPETARLIERIARGKPATLPGYSSLRELSQDPELDRPLKLAIVRLWKRLAVDWPSLDLLREHFARSEPPSTEELREFVRELKNRVEMGFTPLILFGARRSPSIHVVPVYELREGEYDSIQEAHYTKACFIDNHGSAEEHTDCGNHLKIYDNGRIQYDAWPSDLPDSKTAESPSLGNIKYVVFTPEDEAEMLTYAQRLEHETEAVSRDSKN